jgi:XTP/dITP diphosphohydrolase
MSYKVIFATKNKGKIREIQSILKNTPFEVISMEDAGITLDVEETGITFEENAIIKAKEIMLYSNSIVMADDSGLEIDCLNKEPGVYSARYGGENTSYDIKNQMILDRMKDIPEKERTSRFVCVIATAFPDGKIITTKGTIEGRIAMKPRGTEGFGYDPIFYVPEYACTTAEMPADLKNKISHRGQALEAMKKELLKYIQ